MLIFSNRAVWTIDGVVDGLTHWYYGLYANMAKHVVRGGGCVFWYAMRRSILFEVDPNAITARRASLLEATIKSLRRTLCRSNLVILLIDYPNSFLGVRHLPQYLAVLLTLHVFRLLKRIFVVVDNMDHPIEHAMELQNGRVGLLQKALWTLLNSIALRYYLIVFHSNAYRAYHKLYYGIDHSRSEVVPSGSFPLTKFHMWKYLVSI